MAAARAPTLLFVSPGPRRLSQSSTWCLVSIDFTDALTISETLAIVASVVVLIRQLRIQQRQQGFMQTNRLANEIQKIDSVIMQRPFLSNVLGEIRGTNDKAIQEQTMVYLLLNFGEMLFWLSPKKQKLLDNEHWEPWSRTLDRWLMQKKTRQLVLGYILPNELYTQSYRNYLSERITATKAQYDKSQNTGTTPTEGSDQP